MEKKNIFYAQSGGVTAVINASACGLIETAKKNKHHFGKIYAGKDGILGALHENLIDLSKDKLKSLEDNKAECQRLIEVFKAHNIGYFFYNGGNDSQDTAHKVSLISKEMDYPLTCIGIPKTIDNDLAFTDNCPGFGSVAKYVAVSIREAGMDVASMASSSTKVFILEVMGRHTGWIASAAGLASEYAGAPPHLILFPEIFFNEENFLVKVASCVKKYGYCTIVVSEGTKNKNGEFLSEAGLKDAFGHAQLGGVAPVIAQIIKTNLNLKYHWAVADYLQRSARHIASKVDVEQAYALGQAAIQFALKGKTGVMPTIIRTSNKPYRWKIGEAPLEKVANQEKHLPRKYITEDGFHITNACRNYLRPLITGEDYPPYKNGLPDYVKLKNKLVLKKLSKFNKTSSKENKTVTIVDS